MGLCSARCGQVAGPAITFRRLNHPGPHRIQNDIPANLKKMAVLLDQDCLVPPLKQMAGPAVPFIEKLGVDTVQLAHAQGQVAVRGFDEKMIMIGHETVSVADPVISFVDVLEGVQKVLAVGVVFKDGFLFVAA